MTWWPWRRAPKPFDPAPYAGNWVALKGGVVIAHAPTAQAIVKQLLGFGPAGRGSTAFYVKADGTVRDRGDQTR